ncbi:MAG: hypothetical protein JWR26_978 [Pedosphaera sp.]|nr:hypothetical protein [Pedosphaera sp.]
MAKKFLPVLLLGLLLTGCTTATLTNLTPHQEFRNASGLYPVEAAMASRQQTLRWDTVRPNVVVDTEFLAMRPTLLMTNRWETLIPVPPGKNVVYYRFKFDYDYLSMGARKSDSVRSPVYRLQILDQ